jgi:hypothetical protein
MLDKGRMKFLTRMMKEPSIEHKIHPWMGKCQHKTDTFEGIPKTW